MPHAVGHARSVLIAARNEGDRIAETVQALREAFGDARVIVADGGSADDTATRGGAGGRGARAVRDPGREGRLGDAGGAAGAGGGRVRRARVRALRRRSRRVLRGSSGRWRTRSRPGSAISRWPRSRTRRGGGFGIAVGFARWAVRSLTGLELRAPISGQRAMRGSTLRAGAAVRARIRDGDRDDDRRRACGPGAWARSSWSWSTARPVATSPASCTAVASWLSFLRVYVSRR